MELTGSYRHELKYQISPADALALRQRLRAVMKRDPHTGADGLYTIRSVYFDNYGDKALREKVNGVQKREKFRIRYYNDDFSFITLEKKIKHNDLCMKIDAPLTVEEKRAWLDAVTGVSLGSDAFFPFGDNIERARRSGVTAIVQPGGSIRDDQVIATCNKYGIAMAFCGIRLFHH